MPKRSATENIEHYSDKIKKIQKNNDIQERRNIVFSSSGSGDSHENWTRSEELVPLSASRLRMSPVRVSQLLTSPSHEIVLLDRNDTAMPEIDPELLRALGDATDDIPLCGPNIHRMLAQRWLPILKKGLHNDLKNKLLKEFTVPENCKLLKAPTLNPEIAAAISNKMRRRDTDILEKQDQLGIGITAINRAMSLLLTGNDKVQTVKILSDSCRILADLHFTETQLRTKLITPELDKSFLTVIQDHERDETLFGNNLSEKIKVTKKIKRQGFEIKKVSNRKPSPSNTSPETTQPRFQEMNDWKSGCFNSPCRRCLTTPYCSRYYHAPPASKESSSTLPSTSTSKLISKRSPKRQ